MSHADQTYRHIACDLGAESGRVILGTLQLGDAPRLHIEEVHRFANGPVAMGGSIRWNVVRIFEELKAGLAKIAVRGVPVASLSADSWGVDYVLLHGNEPLLTLPYHYRDARTDGGLERAFSVLPAAEIFDETGLQFMTLNTLYQLHADIQTRPELLKMAEGFLNIGDYFNFLFSGVRRAEASLASTTQIYNPRTRGWSKKIIERFGFPSRIFPEVVPSGTVLGPLLPAIESETKLSGVQVVATCSHDTGAAVAAVPGEGDDWAYLSSGTWSLLGIESPEPIISAKSREHNFTNEVGYGGSIRFLKNIIGLWLVQECRREWARGGQEYSYERLTELASQAEPLRSFVNPDAPRFGKPGEMPRKIHDYCVETGQQPPRTPGETVRCALESLALKYARTLDELTAVTGRTIRKLHIVGGGSRNQLLNQLAANATGRTVLAGPVEATAIGNLLIQSMALGHLKSLATLRQAVRASQIITTFEPQDTTLWKKAVERFNSLPAK